MFCTKCGKQLSDDSLYCRFCGSQVKKVSSEGALRGVGVKRKESAKTKIIIPVSIICIIGILSMGASMMVNSPEKIIADFVDAICSLDIDKASDCLDPNSMKAFNIGAGITDMFLDGMGLGISSSDLLGVMNLFGGSVMNDSIDLISTRTRYRYKYGFSLGLINKLICEDAVVNATLQINGETEMYQIPMHRYGWNGWKIDGSKAMLSEGV